MTSMPTSQVTSAPSARPAGVVPSGGAPAGGSGVGAGSVDPIKLLQRYKWVLALSLMLGGVLGVAGHFALMKVYPRWRAAALFEASAAAPSVREAIANTMNDQEANRFMQTQARTMISTTVLQAVAEDPSFPQQAPRWAAPFVNEAGLFDTVTATRELSDYVDARPIPNTFLIQLSCTYTHPEDATTVVRFVREKYMDQLRRRGTESQSDRTRVLEGQLDQLDQDIAALQQRREREIRQRGLDSVNDRVSAQQQDLQETQRELLMVTQELEARRSQLQSMERERNNPAGPEFGDNLREEADRDPVVVNIRERIASLQSEIQAQLNRGMGTEHRLLKELQSRIDGAQQNLDQTRNTVLQRLFNGQLDSVRKIIDQLLAQQAELQSRRETLQTRLTDLTSAQRQIEDLDLRIQSLQTERTNVQSNLGEITAAMNLPTAIRITVAESERVPTQPVFPRLQIMIPLGMLATLGLASLVIFVRELVDQRIKGPSDVMLIPRARLLGWIPDASEDPAGQGNIETAFRDRSRGVVAESFRQLRGAITKRIGVSGSKVILVMSAMPGSGATSAVSNLGLAFASADKRVLLIDANFRRPGLHRAMGLQEAPGLADLLQQRRDLGSCVQATSTPNLDLLSAGSKQHRVYEALSTQAMTELLREARERYDLVLVDVAPAIVAGDGLSLASKCDASLLVVRAMAEKRGLVARVKNELSDTRAELLGLVVNGVRSSAGGYLRGNIRAAAQYAES